MHTGSILVQGYKLWKLENHVPNQPLRPQNETSQCLSTILGEFETPITTSSILYYMTALNKHASLH